MNVVSLYIDLPHEVMKGFPKKKKVEGFPHKKKLDGVLMRTFDS